MKTKFKTLEITLLNGKQRAPSLYWKRVEYPIHIKWIGKDEIQISFGQNGTQFQITTLTKNLLSFKEDGIEVWNRSQLFFLR